MFVALAPVARVDSVKGLFKYLSHYQATLEGFFRAFGIRYDILGSEFPQFQLHFLGFHDFG